MKDFRRPSGQGAGRFEKREGGSDFRPRSSSTYEGRDHSSGGYKGNRGDHRGESFSRDEAQTLHKATCAECNKTCEVPFRPNGKKPVYCKDCFGAKKTPGGNSNRFEKSEFTRESAPYVREERRDREQSHSQAAPAARDSRIDDLKSQVDALNTKLDRVLKALEASNGPAAPAAKPVEKKAYVPANAAPTLNVAMKDIEKPAAKAAEPKKAAKAPAAKKAEVKAAPAKKPAAAKVVAKAKPAAKKKK